MKDLVTKLQEVHAIINKDPALKAEILGIQYSFHNSTFIIHTHTHHNNLAEITPRSDQYDQQQTEVAPGIVVLTLLPREKVSA